MRQASWLNADRWVLPGRLPATGYPLPETVAVGSQPSGVSFSIRRKI